MTKSYSYLSANECLAEFDRMGKTDKAKLMLNCQNLCLFYDLSIEGCDLLNEMFARVLSGSRNIPKGEDFLISLSWVCKSIAEGMLTKTTNRQEKAESVSLDTVSMETEIDTAALLAYETETDNSTDERLRRIIDYFKDDEGISNLIRATLDGLKPREIVKSVFLGDKKAYDATRKRFTRAIPLLRKEEAGV